MQIYSSSQTSGLQAFANLNFASRVVAKYILAAIITAFQSGWLNCIQSDLFLKTLQAYKIFLKGTFWSINIKHRNK